VSNRIIRINELVQRELGDILRQRHAAEAVGITVTEVRISPDLRDGRVFVAVIGDQATVADRFRWVQRHAKEFRAELSQRITIKFLPRLTYVLDESSVRAAKLLNLIDALPPAAPEPEEGDGSILS